MKIFTKNRYIYPVDDDKIPALLENLRRGGRSAVDWCLIAADTVEGMQHRLQEHEDQKLDDKVEASLREGD